MSNGRSRWYMVFGLGKYQADHDRTRGKIVVLFIQSQRLEWRKTADLKFPEVPTPIHERTPEIWKYGESRPTQTKFHSSLQGGVVTFLSHWRMSPSKWKYIFFQSLKHRIADQQRTSNAVSVVDRTFFYTGCSATTPSQNVEIVRWVSEHTLVQGDQKVLPTKILKFY